MRTLTLVLTIGLLVLGVTALARGEDEGTQIADLEKQVDKLERQVTYLMARDADVTKFLSASEARGASLERTVALMIQWGYTNKATPARSREALAAGLKALGTSLRTDVPVVTEKQAALLKGSRARK